MSHPTKCDICGRCDDEKGVNIDRHRKTNWFFWWSYAEMDEKLDICDYCWNGWKSFMQNRLAAKEPTPREG